MQRNKGTLLYCTSSIEEFTQTEWETIIETFHLNRRISQLAYESDTHDVLRLLIQRGAKTVEGLRIARGDDGAFHMVGQPVRLFG